MLFTLLTAHVMGGASSDECPCSFLLNYQFTSGRLHQTKDRKYDVVQQQQQQQRSGASQIQEHAY